MSSRTSISLKIDQTNATPSHIRGEINLYVSATSADEAFVQFKAAYDNLTKQQMSSDRAEIRQNSERTR